MTWLEVCLLLAAGLLLGGLAGALWDIRRLHAKIWTRWVVEAELRRMLELEKARAAHAQAAYDRRVARWRDYAIALQDAAISLGLMAPWKAEADRQAAPFVDSGVAPLDG